MKNLEIYGIGCVVVFVIVLVYILNEWLHGKNVKMSCAVSCVFMIAMSWSAALVVLWVLIMNGLEHFKWDDIVVIKGKQKK